MNMLMGEQVDLAETEPYIKPFVLGLPHATVARVLLPFLQVPELTQRLMKTKSTKEVDVI